MREERRGEERRGCYPADVGEVKCSDWGEGRGSGNHAGIIHLLQEGDSPGNDVAVLIAPSHVTHIHSIENAANGSTPGFVCECVCVFVFVYACVKVCVQQ